MTARRIGTWWLPERSSAPLRVVSSVQLRGDVVVATDAGEGVAAVAPCRLTATHRAECPLPSTGIRIDAEDADDEITVSPDTAVAPR